MKTYAAGKHDDRELRYAGTREWVFPLLPTRRYRDRIGLLSGLELRRRADCEPTLRALVTNDWTPETIHHIGWCDSCRTAGFALGMGTPAAAREIAGPIRRRAALVGVAAAIAIAVPVVASQTLDNPFGGSSQAAGRGGSSHIVPQSSPGTGSSGSSGSAGSTGSSGSSGSSGASGSGTTTTPIVPVPRAKGATHLSRAHHAHTVVVPAARGERAQLPLTT